MTTVGQDGTDLIWSWIKEAIYLIMSWIRESLPKSSNEPDDKRIFKDGGSVSSTRPPHVEREDETGSISFRIGRFVLFIIVAVFALGTIFQTMAGQLQWLDIISIICVVLPLYMIYHRDRQEMTLGLYIAILGSIIVLFITASLVMVNYGILPFQHSNYPASQAFLFAIGFLIWYEEIWHIGPRFIGISMLNDAQHVIAIIIERKPKKSPDISEAYKDYSPILGKIEAVRSYEEYRNPFLLSELFFGVLGIILVLEYWQLGGLPSTLSDFFIGGAMMVSLIFIGAMLLLAKKKKIEAGFDEAVSVMMGCFFCIFGVAGWFLDTGLLFDKNPSGFQDAVILLTVIAIGGAIAITFFIGLWRHYYKDVYYFLVKYYWELKRFIHR